MRVGSLALALGLQLRHIEGRGLIGRDFDLEEVAHYLSTVLIAGSRYGEIDLVLLVFHFAFSPSPALRERHRALETPVFDGLRR